MRDEGDNERII